MYILTSQVGSSFEKNHWDRTVASMNHLVRVRRMMMMKMTMVRRMTMMRRMAMMMRMKTNQVSLPR